MDKKKILEHAKNVIIREAVGVTALLTQLDDSFYEAVSLLSKCKGHVLVTGAGTSRAVAIRLAHLMTCCGTPAMFLHPGDAGHGDAGVITKKDILIAISKGGGSGEVNFLAEAAGKRGSRVIVMTEKRDSGLARLADIVLAVKTSPAIDELGMIALGSSLACCAYGDALCSVLLKLNGRTLRQFSATHPAGAVGRKLSKINRK